MPYDSVMLLTFTTTVLATLLALERCGTLSQGEGMTRGDGLAEARPAGISFSCSWRWEARFATVDRELGAGVRSITGRRDP